MRDSKSTKRALAASVGCVALCSAMLVGTTFAWFTDTATTNVNGIQAGTLNVALQWKNGDNWYSAEDTTLAFKKAAGASEDTVIWEPGCTYELPQIRVVNNGNLALKYRIEIIGLDGDDELNDVLDWTINDEAFDSTDYSLAAGAQSDALTIKAHMQETANNSYQGKSLSGVKISVTATQDTVEYDSYNNTYDARAAYAVPDTATPVSTATELATAISEGKDVVLTQDITLTNPESSSGDAYQSLLDLKRSATIYGNGTYSLILENENNNYDRVINIESDDLKDKRLTDITLTLSGVNIVGPEGDSYNRGISAWGVQNLNIIMDNCTASANHYALMIGGSNSNVNVTVRNSTLTGYAAFRDCAGSKATFENCTLEGVNQWPGSAEMTDNDFSTIALYPDAKDADLTFKNCIIKATEKSTAKQTFLATQATETNSSSGSIAFEGCTFIYNGEEITELDDILTNCSFSSADIKLRIDDTEINFN